MATIKWDSLKAKTKALIAELVNVTGCCEPDFWLKNNIAAYEAGKSPMTREEYKAYVFESIDNMDIRNAARCLDFIHMSSNRKHTVSNISFINGHWVIEYNKTTKHHTVWRVSQ